MITDFEHMVALSKLEHVQQILEKFESACPGLTVALGLVEELKEPYLQFFGLVLEEEEMEDDDGG